MLQSFGALGVSAPVVEVLTRLGIRSPFPIQTLVLPDALAGVDVVAASPTGSGKTLAFGIPMVERTAREGGPVRSYSSRPASSPLRSPTTCGPSPRRASCGSRRSTAAHPSADRRNGHGTPTCSSPPPAVSTTLSNAGSSRSGRSACSSSTKPIGCSTWASARRSTASSSRSRRSVKRCSSRPRSTDQCPPWPAATRSIRPCSAPTHRSRPRRATSATSSSR